MSLQEDCLAEELTAVQVAAGKEMTTLCPLVLPMWLMMHKVGAGEEKVEQGLFFLVLNGLNSLDSLKLALFGSMISLGDRSVIEGISALKEIWRPCCQWRLWIALASDPITVPA